MKNKTNEKKKKANLLMYKRERASAILHKALQERKLKNYVNVFTTPCIFYNCEAIYC